MCNEYDSSKIQFVQNSKSEIKRRNIEQVFIENGNGIDYEVVEESHVFSLTIEQKLQKELKKEKAILFKCVKNYAGYTFPILSYPKNVPFAPCCDNTLEISVGEEIIITRGRKHWYYGYKSNNTKRKGFVPKACLEEIVKYDQGFLDIAKNDLASQGEIEDESKKEL